MSTATTTPIPSMPMLAILHAMHVPTFLPKAKPAAHIAAPHPADPSKAGRCFSIREGSIAWVVMSYFIHNPDEELTSADAAIKADATPRQVELAMAACVRDQYLSTTTIDRPKRCQKPMLVYSAGPKLAAAAAHMHSINPATVPRKPVGSF